jgi:Tfp pilus assembly protein PilO
MFENINIKGVRSPGNVFVLASAALVVLVAYFWVLSPHVGYLKASKHRMAVVKKLRQKHDFLTNLVAARQKQMQTLRQKLTDSKVCDSLFAPSEAKSFFNEIQAVAEASKCTVESLNFTTSGLASSEGQPWEGGYVVPEHANVTVLGGYMGIVEFMNRLQDRLEKVWIDSVRIGPAKDGGGQLQCDFKVTVYVMHECEDADE